MPNFLRKLGRKEMNARAKQIAAPLSRARDYLSVKPKHAAKLCPWVRDIEAALIISCAYGTLKFNSWQSATVSSLAGLQHK